MRVNNKIISGCKKYSCRYLALAVARYAHAHHSPGHHPLSLHRYFSPATGIFGSDATQLAPTTRYWPDCRRDYDFFRHHVSHTDRWPLVSLAYTPRNQGPTISMRYV